MRDFGSSARHRLFSSTAFLMTCMFPGKGAAQDFTKALIWSTYSSTDVPQLSLFYGNPATYVSDIANGRNGSYFPYYYTFNGAVGIGALDMLYSESDIYYSLNMKLHYSAQLIPRTGAETSYALAPALSTLVTGFSIDWVSQLIYWSDASYQRICMFDIATLVFWRVVVDTNLTSPQDVVVYPQQSLLFWSDFGDNSIIERFHLATDDRRILLSSPTLQRPTKLVVDFANLRLFWLDASAATIGSMNFDGFNVSFWTLSTFSSVSSFAVFQDYMFLGRNDVNVIYIYDRNETHRANITAGAGKGIIDMSVYSQERNPYVNSPCTTKNGGCDQLCITVNSTQRRCMCAMGLFLASDGFNCVTKPMQIDKFLLVSDQRQCNIFQISVDTGEVRALTYNKDVFPYTTALAFDPFKNYLYYYDKSVLVIMRTSLDATDSKSLPNVTNALGGDITSLAFDSENQVLFFVDYLVQTISTTDLSSLSTITIYSQAGSRPRTIVLDTSNRLLYWSDCGKNTIERGSKTNPYTNRKAIVSGLSDCAMTFAIDFQNQAIFWAYASGSIETAMLDGTARSVVFQDSNAVFTGLALDAQFIYVAASNIGQIQKIDRNTKQLSNLTKILFTQPFALLYYSADTASTDNNGVTTTTTTTTTTIIVASVVSGAVVLIAVIVTVGVVFVKRRGAASRRGENNPTVVMDNSRTYETINADRRDNPIPQRLANESDYAGEIVYTPRPHSYESIRLPSEYSNRRQTVAPPPYGVANKAASRIGENNPTVVIDNSHPYETLDTNRRDNPIPQMFTNESHYADEIGYTPRPHSYLSIKYSFGGPTGMQTVAPPPYEDADEFV